MLGKPPRLAYEGIGYIASPRSPKDYSPVSKHKSPLLSTNTLTVSNPSSDRRPSIGSSSFSEYDDLRDFEGRFESCSTLGVMRPGNDLPVRKRKLPTGFLRRRKGIKSAQSPTDEKISASTTGRGLKALRSVGSLRSKASASAATKSANDPVPKLPPTLSLDCNLDLDDVAPPRTSVSDPTPTFTKFTSNHDYYSTLPKCRDHVDRPSSRRSASYTAASSPRSSTSIPSSPVPSTFTSYTPSLYGNGQQAALGNALIAASHAESANGTHSDLLQILNRENHSWGFSYSSYPHKVYVWYGDRDEKIAENGIHWMEKTMGEEQCHVKVVKGADHGLMYKSSVVVEVLEHIREYWP
jgi:hypothetical protein